MGKDTIMEPENFSSEEYIPASHNAPRKVGLPRFFELLGRDLWPFYQASFLCMLACLPGFLGAMFGVLGSSMPICLVSGLAGGLIAGPFISGMLDTVLRSLRDEPGYWWHTYKMAWRQNWRDSLVPGLAFGGFLGIWAWLIGAMTRFEKVPTPVWLCGLLGLLFGSGFFAYLMSEIPLVNLPLRTKIKNALLMFMGFFPRTLACAILLCVYFGAMVLYFPYSVPVYIVFGFWLPVVVALMILYPALDKVFKLEETINARRAAELEEHMNRQDS